MTKNKLQRYNPTTIKLVKKAIREAASHYKIGKNSYHKLSTNQLFEYMLDNRMGVQWITVERVRRMRATLPKMYREKSDD